MKTPVPPTDYRPAKAAALRFSLLAAMAASLTPKNASAEAQPVPGEAAGCPAEARERLIRGLIPADPVPVRTEDEAPADFENTPRAIFIEPRAVSDVIPAASEATTANRIVVGGTPMEPNEVEARIRKGWFFQTPRMVFIEPESVLALSPEEQKRLADAYNETMRLSTFGARARHTVQEGETLSGIAAKTGATVALIAADNGIQDPDKLRVGQELVVPVPPISSILDVFPSWSRMDALKIEDDAGTNPPPQPPTMGLPPMEPAVEPEQTDPLPTMGEPPMEPAAEPEQTEPPRVMGVPPMEPAAEPSREP